LTADEAELCFRTGIIDTSTAQGQEKVDKIRRFLAAYQHMITDRDFMLSRKPDTFWCVNPAHESKKNYKYWNGYTFDCHCGYSPTGDLACEEIANTGNCVETGPFTATSIEFGKKDYWNDQKDAETWYAIDYVCKSNQPWCIEGHTHTLLDTLNAYIHGKINPWESNADDFDLDWVTNFLQYFICTHDTTLKYDSIHEGLWAKLHTRLRNVRSEQPNDMESYLEDRVGRTTSISQCNNEDQDDDNNLCDAVYESQTERLYTKVGGLKEDMQEEAGAKEAELDGAK